MKKLLLILLACIAVVFTACNTANDPQNDSQSDVNAENQDITGESTHVPTLLPSKFADYLTSVVTAELPDNAVYYLEKAVTVDGVTTSIIKAVKNGTVLSITETAGIKNVSIVSRDTATTLDVASQTYSQTTCDEAAYNAVMSNVECASKYYDIEFTPSAYTVVDKDQYAEVAMIDGTPHIFIFDDNYALKYIVYAREDGVLITEEIFAFTAEVDDELFAIPESYTAV